MKKKFIFLAMILLTLIGGVKWNVLNAQEVVTIGDGTAINLSDVPCKTNYDNTLSQQIFLADDFDGKTGNITSYAFKCARDLTPQYSGYTCNFKIYMTNTDKTSFESASDYVNMSLESLVFEGVVSFQSAGEWTIINFDTPFEYEEGKNVLLCITNASPYMNVSMNYYSHSTTEYRSISTYKDGSTPFDVTNITPSIDKKANTNVTHSQFTFESSAPAVMPSSVPEIVSVEATHNSVTLAWTEVENAKKYNVYTSTGDLVTTVSTTSCTIEGLNELTEYCYQVSAVNGEFETEKSTASCATTLEAPKERTLVFELKDTFGDGWNGNSLKVYFNGVLQQSYTISSGASGYYELIVPQGNVVKMVYDGSGQYQSENSFTIYYKDGTLINGQEKITGTGGSTHTVVEFVYGPVLLVEASAYDIFSDQTATLTATAVDFDGDVTYRWLLNGEEVGTESSFIFDPETIGTYTFTCVVSDSKDTKESDVTINVHESVLGKWFRVKVNQGGSYMGYYLNVNQYYTSTSGSTVGITGSKTASNMQKFTIESNGLGQYYLKSADGYYIKCETGGSWWNVHAYSTTEKTPLVFEYTDGEQFYIKDYDKMTGNSQTGDNNNPGNSYFKVENNLVYCDAPINYTGTPPNTSYLTTWIFEEINFSATAYAYNENIFDNESTTFSVTAMDGSGNYTYSWSPIDGLDDATSANPTFSPSAPGTYTFTCTVTDTESNATAEASVTVNVSARPALQLTVSADKNLIYNDDETAVLTATVTEGTGYAPYTYSWTLNGEQVGTEATYSFSNTTVGEYTLTCTVTDARNNTQTASATIEVKDASERPLEIELGTDSGSSSSVGSYLPSNVYYKYSLTQQIYTKSELNRNENVNITSIAFKAAHSYPRKLDIYLRNTSDVTCGNENYSYAMQSDECYFSGEVAFTNGDWTIIALNKPFEYDASQNILLCVDDNTGSYIAGGTFAIYNSTSSSSWYVYTDGTNYNPLQSIYGSNVSSYKNHIKLGYEIPAPKPENLVATPAQIHVGETTTLTWNELEGAVSYNIYVNGELKDNTTELSYELSGLTYNVEGHTVEVAAVYADDTESGKASVTVQVGGTFTIGVTVTDGTNYIEGAEVSVDMTYAYDEFFNKLEIEVEPAITNEQGFANVTLPLLAKYYDEYDGMWITPYYTVRASKAPYSNAEDNVYCAYISNSQTVGRTLVLTLPTVSYIQVQDEEGNDLYGYVMEGTNVVLSWDELEGATAYKVYKLNHLNETIEEEVVTDATYQAYAEYNADGFKYGVSAIFNDVESDVTYTSLIKVIGEGTIKGKVTDGVNPVADALIRLEGESSIGGEIVPDMMTNESGEFVFDVTEGTYTLSVYHHNYDEYVRENVVIAYYQTNDLGTIELTPKAAIDENVTVTADNNGNVSWTGDYAKWNVYRRNTNAPQELTSVATELEATSTTDPEWETLEAGTYEYGVSTFVEGGTEMGVQLSANFDDGVMPEGWNVIDAQYTSWWGTQSWYWYVYNGRAYSYYAVGDITTYLITPIINTKAATLSFEYFNSNNSDATSNRNELSVKYATSPDGPWNDDALYYSQYQNSWTTVTLDLSKIEHEKVYIAFCNTNVGEGGGDMFLDNIVITGEVSSSIETQIVWSEPVVKQGPNTFEGTVTTDWNVAENWSNGNVPEAGDEVIVNAEAVISGNVELSTLNIVGNGSVTVDANASLTVTGAITQEKDYSLIMNDGAQVFQNNANVTAQFNMNLVNPSDWSTSNKDGWQFISSPLSNVSVTNIAEGNYDLYKYDGDAESELEWLNHKDENFADATYQHHIGYLASHETMSTLEFKGTLNYNDYNGSYAFYDFVKYYENEPLKNFYLIGNPYPFNISWADFKNNKGMVNGYAYVKEDGNYEYATSGEIAVGDGFFVQAISGTPDDQYSTFYYYVKGSGNTRSTKASNNSLNITATGNAGKDNVVINLAGKSEGFNKLQNFNDAIATVYVAEDGKNYGIYNCDADVQEIELSFNANQMGNYTISIEPNGKFQTVTLVDRFTGIETDMLVEDYHFTAMSNVNTNRFIIKMVNGQQTTDNSHFVFQSGEDLIIDAEGTVQIIDVMGRVLVSDEVESTNNRINVSGFQNGTYMVRVINGSEVKVEKVVIY